MLIIFTCENCGKRFKVDERLQGKRGRCSHCGHVMRIPEAEVPRKPPTATAPPPRPTPEPPFRLSPPEPRPVVRRGDPASRHRHSPAHQPVGPHHSVFRLASSDARPRTSPHLETSPTSSSSCSMMTLIRLGRPRLSGDHARSARDRRVRERSAGATRSTVIEAGFSLSSGCESSGPAGWLYMKWRAGVSFCAQAAPLGRHLGLSHLGPVPHADDLRNRRREPAIRSHRGGRGRSGELRAILGRLARVLRPAVQGWAAPRAWRSCFRLIRSIT